MTGETQGERKTSRCVSMSTTNPTRTDLILNLGCHSDRSATNRTSHGVNNGQIFLENLNSCSSSSKIPDFYGSKKFVFKSSPTDERELITSCSGYFIPCTSVFTGYDALWARSRS
jgi:hypothetical protein